MKPFQSKKAIWWSVGLFVLLVGVFIVAIVLPGRPIEPDGESKGPDVDVPSMRNTPERSNAHPLDVALKMNEETE